MFFFKSKNLGSLSCGTCIKKIDLIIFLIELLSQSSLASLINLVIFQS